MSKKDIYTIKIVGWEKYNGTLKAGHKKIMISTGFLTDAKIRKLTPATKLLYLSCLLIAGESLRSHNGVILESTRGQFEVSHESLVFQSGVKSGSLQSQLDLLQSLQLLRYEEMLPNRREEKRREENYMPAVQKAPPPASEKSESVAPTKIKSSLSKPFIPKTEVELFDALPSSVKARWVSLYPDKSFIEREVIKSFGWYELNSRRKPTSIRGWAQALSRWLDKSWQQFGRTSQPKSYNNGRSHEII